MKVNKKVKTIQISEQTHSYILKYCNDNSLKLSQFVDKLLTNAIRSLNVNSKPKTE